MGWLGNWQYRKKITIQGQSGAGTDYQILLKVGESSGASGCDFHVEEHSSNFPSDKNQSGDLRFTKNDGTTLLYFWVEKVEGTSPNKIAYVWVKITDNLDNNVDIYCYYGNSDATNVSNSDDTFIFFDDFQGSSLDSNKWDGSGNYTVADDHITLEAGASIKSKNEFSMENTTVEILVKIDSNYRLLLGYCERKIQYDIPNSGGGEWQLWDNSGNKLDQFDGLDPTVGSYQWWKLQYLSDEIKIYLDADYVGNFSDSYRTTSKVETYHWYSGTIEIDQYRIRKYISPEPSFSSASGEEKEVTETYAINILLQNLENKNYNIDSIIRKSNLSALFTLDLLIQQLNISFDYLTNALFRATKSYSYNLEISLFDTNYVFFDGMILQLIWNDEFNNSEIDAIKRLTLAQSYNIQEFNVCEKPITLEATENQGWLTRKQVEMLYQKASVPNKIYPLIYNGKHYLVRFRWEDPPVIDVTPILPRPNMADDDYYYGTIKLMQILR